VVQERRVDQFLWQRLKKVIVGLRDYSYHDRVRSISLKEGLTHRDQVAVERLSSGLIKLLYPDGLMNGKELREIVILASELRQRVHNQLVVIGSAEFKPNLSLRMTLPSTTPRT
jgi:ATP-dependent Lon protease